MDEKNVDGNFHKCYGHDTRYWINDNLTASINFAKLQCIVETRSFNGDNFPLFVFVVFSFVAIFFISESRRKKKETDKSNITNIDRVSFFFLLSSKESLSVLKENSSNVNKYRVDLENDGITPGETRSISYSELELNKQFINRDRSIPIDLNHGFTEASRNAEKPMNKLYLELDVFESRQR